MKKQREQVNKTVTRKAGSNTTKRVLSFVLALVFILAVLPSSILPEVNAASTGLGPVEMWVRMNGVDNYDKVEIDAGIVADNIGDVTVDNLPEGAEFVKAILIDYDTNIETEVKSVGASGDEIYYSLNADDNAGTLVENNQELILVYGNRYIINDVKTGNGSYTIIAHEDEDDQGNPYQYLWAKEDLVIQAIEPDPDWSLDSINFNSGSSNGSVTVKNNSATIPYMKIKGDITVRVNFTQNGTYSITEGTIAQGGICQDQGVVKQAYVDNQEVTPVAPGETATFMLYSQSWTGGDKWIVNQLMLNGEDVNVPRSTTVGTEDATAETDLSNGSHVTVTLVKTGEGLYWKDGDPRYHYWGIAGEVGEFDRWLKERCLYEVTITNVHENYVVEGNFKDSTKRELIVKGLRGIDLTGAAVEDIRLISGFSVMQRYYTFNSSANNVYTANYTRPVFSESIYPSDNLILYTVKYGYNPYTVETRIFYDGVESDSVRAESVNNDGEEAAAGKPVDVIASAKARDYDDASTGRFDTSFRHWGKNSKLRNQESTYRPSFQLSSKDLLLTTIDKDKNNDWYTVALAQNEALDQQLYLNANPYVFKLNLDVVKDLPDEDELVFSADGFEGDLDAYKEINGNTVVGNHAYTYLPTAEPQKEGYIFQYWQLVDAEGNEIENTKKQKSQYAPGDQFKLTEQNVALVMGDKTKDEQQIRFKAVWKEVQESSKTMIDVSAYHQISEASYNDLLQSEPENVTSKGDIYYYRYYHQEEKQNVGKIELLNLHKKDLAHAKYYVLNEENSKLNTTATTLEEGNTIPAQNKLYVYYDYKTVKVDLEKEVKGRPKTKEYTITLTLIKPDDSPVSVDEAIAMMGLSAAEITAQTENTITITKKYGKNSKLSLAKVPYGWDYTLVEDASEIEGDFEAEYDPSGTLTKDTKIVVTNTGSNPGIVVDKKLTYNEDTDDYTIDLASYATGETYTQQLDAAVPLDIAVVINQSTTLTANDVVAYNYVTENGSIKRTWTVNEAINSGTTYYYRTGGKYYPVCQAIDYEYVNEGKISLGTILPDSESNYLYGESDAEYRTTEYYIYNSEYDEAYPVYYKYYGNFIAVNDGDESLSWTAKFYYTTDTSVTSAQAAWDSSSRVDIKVGGDTACSMTRGFGGSFPWIGKGSISTSDANKKTEVDLFKRVSLYGIGYEKDGDVTQIPYTSFNRSKDVAVTDETPLYSKGSITRLQALKNAANSFVEKVAEQSQQNSVDHKVAIIGYANNELPSRTSSSDKIIGESKYITVNTGLFIDGVFKNYMTPDLANKSIQVGRTANEFLAYMKESRTGTVIHSYTHERFSDGLNNLTFFTNDNLPIRYMDSHWKFLEKDFTWQYYAETSANTNGTNWYNNRYMDVVTSGSFPRYHYAKQPYYPAMQTLTKSDYQDALVSAQEGGSVNSNLTTAINSIGAYGGAYLSYGLAMANNVFEYNASSDDDGTPRKRVIVVFTDGEQMGSGSTFDQTSANEALAAASVSKDEYGASVYTVALYPGQNANSQVVDFLQALSSEYYASTDDVYEADLQQSGTYYFIDENGRTHAVTNYSGKENVKFDLQQIGDREIPVTAHSGGEHPQYTWKDSDGWIRASYWDEAEADNPRTNFYQFFKMATSKPTSDSATYAYNASNAEELETMFETISDQVKYPTTTVKLTGSNSFMKDGISEYFDYSGAAAKTTTYDASNSDVDNRDLLEALAGLDDNGWTTSSLTENYLSASGFNYSKNYISEDQNGKVFVAKITGLKLKEGVYGVNIPSNTDDSGVYYTENNDPKMIAEFDQQYTSADPYSATVQLNYEGDRKIEGQKFNVTFKLTKSDGTPYSGEFGNIVFSSEGEFSTKMADGEHKDITNIPKNAILTVTVADPDNADTYYTYAITDTIMIDGQPITTSITGDDSRVGTIEGIDKNHPEILITVTDNRQLFTVTNHTQGQSEQDDFSDKTKKFPIRLTLYKGDSEETKQLVTAETTFIDEHGESIVFEDGKYVAELADQESLILFVPKGHIIEVSDDSQPFNYSTMYSLNGGTETEDPVTAVFDASTSENGNRADVYHTINSIVISGLMDSIQNNTFMYLLGLAFIVAGSWLMIQRRRQKGSTRNR